MPPPLQVFVHLAGSDQGEVPLWRPCLAVREEDPTEAQAANQVASMEKDFKQALKAKDELNQELNRHNSETE